MRTNSNVTSEADSVRKLEKDELKKDELDCVSGGGGDWDFVTDLHLLSSQTTKMDLKGASEAVTF
jgi:hypothetical protein